jgi:transcriptional regulator with XRE-family HTH domain
LAPTRTRTAGDRNVEALARLVGRRIRELREDRGWMQVDLAAHLDGHAKQPTISDYETGRAMPSLRMIARLAAAFEVDVAELFLNIKGDERHRIAARVLVSSRACLAQLAKVLGEA